MYNEILLKLEPRDRLTCRLLSSKFRYFVDSLFKFSLTVCDENLVDLSQNPPFLCPQTLIIGELVKKPTSLDFHDYFYNILVLDLQDRTSQANAQKLLSRHPNVRELHLHSAFLAGKSFP